MPEPQRPYLTRLGSLIPEVDEETGQVIANGEYLRHYDFKAFPLDWPELVCISIAYPDESGDRHLCLDGQLPASRSGYEIHGTLLAPSSGDALTLTTSGCLIRNSAGSRCDCDATPYLSNASAYSSHGPMTLIGLTLDNMQHGEGGLPLHRWRVAAMVAGRHLTPSIRVRRVSANLLGFEPRLPDAGLDRLRFDAIGLQWDIDLEPAGPLGEPSENSRPFSITATGPTVGGAWLTLERVPRLLRDTEAALSLLMGGTVSLQCVAVDFEEATASSFVFGLPSLSHRVRPTGTSRCRSLHTFDQESEIFNAACGVSAGLPPEHVRSWLTALAHANTRARVDLDALFSATVGAFEGIVERSGITCFKSPSPQALKLRALKAFALELSRTREERQRFQELTQGLREPGPDRFSELLDAVMSTIDFESLLKYGSLSRHPWAQVSRVDWIGHLSDVRNNWAHRGDASLEKFGPPLSQSVVFARAKMLLVVLHLWLLHETGAARHMDPEDGFAWAFTILGAADPNP